MKKSFKRITAILCATVYFLTALCFEREGQVALAQEKTLEIYHVHTGNTGTSGGCYGVEVLCNGGMEMITDTITCGRTGSVISQTEWRCGAGHIDYNSVGRGWYEYPHGTYCSEVTGTKTYYRCRNCGSHFDYNPGICPRVLRYEKNCNYGDQEVLARVKVMTSTDEWTREVMLQAEIIPVHNQFNPGSPVFVWNGSASGESSITVRENAVYRLEIQGNANQTGVACDMEIKNIDTEAPVAESVEVIQSEATREQAIIKITASDKGPSGLASEGFSFDGGATWMASGEYRVTNNGSYQLKVRDKVGNQWEGSISVTQIVTPKGATVTTVQNSEVISSAPIDKIEKKETSQVPVESPSASKVQEREYTKNNVKSETSEAPKIHKSKNELIYEETARTPDLSRIVMPKGMRVVKPEEELQAGNYEETVVTVSAPVLLGEKPDGVIQKLENKTGIAHIGIIEIAGSLLIISLGTILLLGIILLGKRLFWKKSQ